MARKHKQAQNQVQTTEEQREQLRNISDADDGSIAATESPSALAT